jgi:hypothetical protein
VIFVIVKTVRRCESPYRLLPQANNNDGLDEFFEPDLLLRSEPPRRRLGSTFV